MAKKHNATKEINRKYYYDKDLRGKHKESKLKHKLKELVATAGPYTTYAVVKTEVNKQTLKKRPARAVVTIVKTVDRIAQPLPEVKANLPAALKKVKSSFTSISGGEPNG